MKLYIFLKDSASVPIFSYLCRYSFEAIYNKDYSVVKTFGVGRLAPFSFSRQSSKIIPYFFLSPHILP